MAYAHNLKQGIDLPVWQWVRFLPASSAAGACLCSDKRGTNRFIYALFSTSSFWKYDTYTDTWMQLASPGALGGSGTWGAGSCMVFDPSQGTAGRVWLFNGYTTQCGFGYYDIATNAWTSRSITNLAAVFGTDGAMTHTCTTYNVSGNDDYIYLIGNASATWYRYSISGNSWAAMGTAITAAVGAGCAIHWDHGTGGDPDKLYIIRGAANATIYRYSIGTPGFTTLTYYPNTETFTTGTCSQYDPVRRYIWIQKDNTHRIYAYDIANAVMLTGPTAPYTGGTSIAGDGLQYIKTPDGAEFLYFRRHTASEFFRTVIGWF